MSIKCLNRVWESATVGGSELLVLLAIADHANDDGGGAWPSKATLAAKTKLSERQVTRILQNLEEKKELVVDRAAGPHGCNMYTVLTGLTTRGKNVVKCYMCSRPETKEGEFVTCHNNQDDPAATIQLCPDCHAKMTLLLGGDKMSPPTGSSDTMSPPPVTSADEGVTPRDKGGDTTMSPDPSLSTQLDPSLNRHCAATAPRSPETPASNGPTPENDPEQPLPPGADLDALPPDQRRRALELASGLAAARHAEVTGGTAARIGDPNEPAPLPDTCYPIPASPWAGDVRRALSDRRRFKLDHDLTPEHIIAVLARFEEHSGITVPGNPSRIRGWAKGARDCIAPMREYLQRAAGNGHGEAGSDPVRAGPDESTRLAVWALDVFFARRERGEYDFAVHSPNSLANTVRALTADLRRLQQAQNLPPHRPPAWEEGQGSARDWAQSDDPAVRAVLEQEQWYKDRGARAQQAQATQKGARP